MFIEVEFYTATVSALILSNHNLVETMSTQITLESTLPYPPLHQNKKFIVLSDWDGTITTADSNDYLTDNLGFGQQKRRAMNLEILANRMNFRDAFREMLESVAQKHTFEDCTETLKTNIQLDTGFKDLYLWCLSNDIPVTIVSSGMAPLIRAVLSKLLDEEHAKAVEIISNDVDLRGDGKHKWKIVYRHPSSGFGHDKSLAILPYRALPSPPVIFFFGDGVSDISAAKHADLLFVKLKADGENDLAAYATKEGIQHVRFRYFKDALKVVQDIVGGNISIEEAVALKEI